MKQKNSAVGVSNIVGGVSLKKSLYKYIKYKSTSKNNY